MSGSLSRRSLSHRCAQAVTVAAVAASAALLSPAAAPADPPPAPTPLTTALQSAPLDSVSRQAAEAIRQVGDVATTPVASPLDAYNTAVETLKALGIAPFLYPTASPFCSNTTGAPFGLAPAVAGAVPGPWPNLNVLGQNLSAVKPGETMFAFVPYGVAKDGADTTGMQLAWFNINTFQGGFVPMGTLQLMAMRAVPATVPPELRPVVEGAIVNFLAASVPFGGVRAVPVDTGKGTVLAAVFGTVKNGASTCFFFPTVGITEVK